MHEQHLYDYAVIRVVPKVEREEFINIGLMMYCKRQKYLRIEFQIPTEKILLFSAEFDVEQLKVNLESFKKICSGKKKAGQLLNLKLPNVLDG